MVSLFTLHTRAHTHASLVPLPEHATPSLSLLSSLLLSSSSPLLFALTSHFAGRVCTYTCSSDIKNVLPSAIRPPFAGYRLFLRYSAERRTTLGRRDYIFSPRVTGRPIVSARLSHSSNGWPINQASAAARFLRDQHTEIWIFPAFSMLFLLRCQ